MKKEPLLDILTKWKPLPTWLKFKECSPSHGQFEIEVTYDKKRMAISFFVSTIKGDVRRSSRFISLPIHDNKGPAHVKSRIIKLARKIKLNASRRESKKRKIARKESEDSTLRQLREAC